MVNLGYLQMIDRGQKIEVDICERGEKRDLVWFGLVCLDFMAYQPF